MDLKWVVVFVLLDIGTQSADAELFTATVFTATSKSLTFQWPSLPGVSSFEITVRNKASNEVKAFATFNGNIVMGSVIGLDPNTEYTYEIEVKIGSATVAGVSDDTFTAPEVMDDIISVTPLDSTTVQMEFVPVSGLSRYIIRTLGPADLFREDEVASSPAQITNLQPDTEYTFSIMTLNDGGISQPSHPALAKTLLPPPQIQSSSSSSSTIELTWTAITNAEKYTVCLLKHNARLEEKMTQNTTNTNYSFSGLDPGALYHIEGYAWDAEGREGEKSAETNQTTRPPAPDSVTITMVNNNDVLGLSVTWTMDPDVYGVVWYNVSSDQGQTCSAESTLSCELTPASCGAVNMVEVVAENSAGPSVPSSAVSFTTIPCPPENLAVTESTPGSCDFSWGSVAHADGYIAYISNADGLEKNCNTTDTNCSFTCECGYTYLMIVHAHNDAGLSQDGPSLNFTTKPCCPTQMNVSLVSSETLEVEWVPARGAELYETRFSDSLGAVLCNDTAPVCVLSYLNCDTPYTVKVIPCNDLSGCNHNCPTLNKDTAPCTPTDLSLTKVNSSTVTVGWTSTNRAAMFLASAKGGEGDLSCTTGGNSCDLNNLPCGTIYEVGVTARSSAGESLPSYVQHYETEPCCPASLSVKQVTQAMTNVSWSEAKGAYTFRTSLSSPKGDASCHTEDTHCIMGCITCGTNYTISMTVNSPSGAESTCDYQGFSSSLCCPSGVRIYRINPNELRVSWRSTSGPLHSTEVNVTGYFQAHNCRAGPGENYCDISPVNCGDEFTVVVVPVKDDGSTEDFCPLRKYSVSCAGSHVGAVFFRGKRSVDLPELSSDGV